LGGVATGSINAQDALIAAGIIKSIGSILAPTAAAPRMGINKVVVAVLLVTSVKNVTARHKTPIISNIGKVDSCSKLAPMLVLKPELVNAVAMVMPAPNSSSIPQGIFSAVSQSMRRIEVPSAAFSPLGITKRAITAKNATMASLVYGTLNQLLQPPNGPLRVIQSSAVTTKTTNTLRSAVVQLPTSGNSM